MERASLDKDGREVDEGDEVARPDPAPPSKHTSEHRRASRPSQLKKTKKKLPKGKVQLLVYINEDLYKELVRVAPVLCGRCHGSISYVVEEALKNYLTPLSEVGDLKVNPRMSVRRVYEQVKAKIREILKQPFTPVLIPEKIFDMAIRETRGPTVIERWKKFFVQEGLIKFVDGNAPNRTVELL
jgi:hypothetical protein